MRNTSTKDLLYRIHKRIMTNLLITLYDLKVTNDIFGTSIKSLKVKTVQKSGYRVQLEIERIPARVIHRYKNVTLSDDIMFVNKIRLFIIISRHIQFGTAELIADAKTSTLIHSVANVSRVYKKRGFRTSTLHVNGQFDTTGI